ncbi:MAG: alanine dehydrogenase [Deltaproteobacteria bacterium]|nr:MAG: alanine dehydrogenase [Deltaproteobacteria bacterium]
MIIGVPKEIKPQEYRVGMTPSGASALVSRGHRVLIERGAGVEAGYPDEEYERAGASVAEREEVWSAPDLVVKVKEPLPEEYPFLREGLTLFTFLHLAAVPDLVPHLLEKKVTAIAYETVTDASRGLPLLKPMSEIAGALSVQVGARGLEKSCGGRGILLAGLPEVRPGKVLIVGAGVSGTMAARLATGIGADVTVLDLDPARLERVRDITGGKAKTAISNEESLSETLVESDLVILAVLIPGKRAPVLVTEEMVKAMKRGACIVDISIDQGGAAETSRPTTHADPYYLTHGVVHYCVANIPSAVARTSTKSLTAMTLPFIIEMAEKGVVPALRENSHLRDGLNTFAGRVTHPGVAESLGYNFHEPEALFP